MLKTGKSYAEQMIQALKKEKKNEKIDYVHPNNDISEGYIIVNYRKRNLERKILMDGQLSMLLPEDWKLWKEELPWFYTYGSSKEKERMALSIQEMEYTKSLDTCIEEVNISRTSPFSIIEKGSIVNSQGIETEYRMLSDEKEIFSALFEYTAGRKKIQGNFLAHYYRRKVWKKVIPQILSQMLVCVDNGKGEGNESMCSRKVL